MSVLTNQYTRPIRKAYGQGVLQQLLRFAVVGCVNTVIDIAIFNLFVWIWPTSAVGILLIYNAIACALAACNSFFWNKYWTFERRQPTTRREAGRFSLVMLATIACNDVIVLLLAHLFPTFLSSAALGANILRISAIAGTWFLSFFGMRLWVFLMTNAPEASVATFNNNLLNRSKSSLTVILPAYNEEVAIAHTVRTTVEALERLVESFEVLVINDGSRDRTGEIVQQLCHADFRIRLINHAHNQGCGAALVSGFEAASKELIFYMDSDGQFDIYDLARFLPLIKDYDAVFGYRINRQDPWMRKFNAWGWNRIVRFVFGVQIQDIDCAFKLYRADFFKRHKLEARGAMLLTEMVYKFARAGYTYTEVGVRHFPRQGGKGTGARISVILRAFREMFFYAGKWFREENHLVG